MEQQPTSGSSFPSDLTTEILLRLPAQSVGRFRCVCKLWLSITTDPCFIKSFGTTRPSVLLCSIENHNLFVTSTPHHTHDQSSIRSYSSSQRIHRYPMKFPGHFSYMDSVHGLICIKEATKPLVWNPTTRQFLPLPTPNMSSRYIEMFLGYDSFEGTHKVVCLPYRKTCYVCRVFTLGSGQESWRTVRTKVKHKCRGRASGQCINGVIYYLACSSPGYDRIVMSFDVRSEIFGMIELPSCIHYIDVLLSYEGRLRLGYISRDNKTRLWILEDADKHKWSFQDFLLPLNEWTLNVSSEENNYMYNRFELKGCTHAGEFIYVPSRLHKSSSFIVFYDPVRNSCRRLKFKGIVDELSMRAFPNHVESLMSL